MADRVSRIMRARQGLGWRAASLVLSIIDGGPSLAGIDAGTMLCTHLYGFDLQRRHSRSTGQTQLVRYLE